MAAKFADIIDSETPVVVDFYADWCGPCKMMKPILEDLKKRVGANVKIIKIDVDRNPQIASTFDIRSIPTIMVFKNKEVVWRQAGVVPAATLEQVIQQAEAQA